MGWGCAMTATRAQGDSAATEPLLVDAREAARLCGLSRSSWLALRAQGRVPRSIRLGRRVLWSTAELSAWVDAGCPVRDVWEARTRAHRRGA